MLENKKPCSVFGGVSGLISIVSFVPRVLSLWIKLPHWRLRLPPKVEPGHCVRSHDLRLLASLVPSVLSPWIKLVFFGGRLPTGHSGPGPRSKDLRLANLPFYCVLCSLSLSLALSRPLSPFPCSACLRSQVLHPRHRCTRITST